MNEFFMITRRGHREDGEMYEDSVTLSQEQTKLLLETLREAIENQPRGDRRADLIVLLCSVDI